MHTTLPTRLAGLLAAGLLALTACGGDDGDTGSSIPDSEPFNQTDVDFATEMIPHHAQALQMVDLTVSRDLDPTVARLAEDIRAAQGPEIEQLVDWLTAWDQPIPETARDHENADGGGMDDMDTDDMPGMMSSDELDGLADLDGDAFEQRWLELMVEHHRGAIVMAEAEQADGAFGPAVDLASDIAQGQAAQVTEMEKLLGS